MHPGKVYTPAIKKPRHLFSLLIFSLQQVSKYRTKINENAEKMGLPVDPMKFLDGAKAAGIPLFGCAVEAEICGIKEKIPQEIKLKEEVI